MDSEPLISHQQVSDQVDRWLQQVVIGLNLCPFALKPYKNKQIRLEVSDCTDEACLLQQLQDEFHRLQQTEVAELETTLLITPFMLNDFYDYNQFLDYVDALIDSNDWVGTFQVATFHPDYQFAGTQADDDENLTNRAPYPILHLLREESLEKAIARYPNPEQIPENNIETVCHLSTEQKAQLFPYLFQ